MAASVSTLPWIWVIEALASFKQVDVSILLDLVKRTPEISDDLGENAREMVSLRILESFFARQSGSKNGGSAIDSKIELDPSKQCENVLRDIVHETSASNLRMDEPEMLKWDVKTFIMHKRASLPKCTLLQLKNAILEGNHPVLASLTESSGLSLSNQSGNRIPMDDGDLNPVARGNLTSPTPENVDGFLQEDAANTTLLPSKRNRSDLDTEDLAAKSYEDGISMDDGSDSHLHNSKKLKQDATFSGQAIGRNCVPPIENDLSDDLLRRIGQQLIRDGCDLAKSSHVRGSQESTFSEDCHDHYVASKRHGQRDGEDASGLLLNYPQNSCNNEAVPEDSRGDGTQRDLPANEAKDNGKQCAEMGTSTASLLYETQQRNHGDESRDKCGNTQINTSNSVPLLDGTHLKDIPDDARDEREHNPRREMSSDSDGYQDEKIDVALKKRNFLSSQCSISQDSLATADCTELNLCMKCNKGGQLLVCSGSACPLVVHQSCVGSAPSFDNSGKFYCPFCAYSHAISEYLEIKKKAAVARNELAVFIGLENGHRVDKHTKRFLVPEQNQFILDENENGNTQANCNENHVNKVNNTQHRGDIDDKKQMEPSVSKVNDDLPCQEEGVTRVDDGTLGALPDGERGGGKLGSQCQSGSALEEQQIEEGGGCDRGDDNSTCRDRESGHETKGHGEDEMRKEVLQQPIANPNRRAARLPKVDVGESSEEENDKATSNYRIKRRSRGKQKKQYTYPAIPQLRRKKVSWTSAEEEILKDGMRKFSSIHDRNIPWKRILEFGSDVFQKGRTTIDLKDKWRNICKGSPKSK
ncbi:hypothetical protein RHSIM_Rhsim04G0100400 [Rhododendron simsii]|uniref:Myb-like domain-containing protein n=1 Tax=Rhododendron simsii TaxID=118357 RepID=A0A834LRH5_RHOSS|nr:hypothetical protein RHSIM_Rhsim04G0100400 [Rhododendron simsii]